MIDEGGDHELRHARRAMAVQIIEAPQPLCGREVEADLLAGLAFGSPTRIRIF